MLSQTTRRLALLFSLLLSLTVFAETYKGQEWSIEIPPGWGDSGVGITSRNGCEFSVFYLNEKMSTPAAAKALNPSKRTNYFAEGPITIQGRKGFHLDYQDGSDKFRYIMIPARQSQHVYTIVCKFRIDNFTEKLPEVMKVVETIRFSH